MQFLVPRSQIILSLPLALLSLKTPRHCFIRLGTIGARNLWSDLSASATERRLAIPSLDPTPVTTIEAMILAHDVVEYFFSVPPLQIIVLFNRPRRTVAVRVNIRDMRLQNICIVVWSFIVVLVLPAASPRVATRQS